MRASIDACRVGMLFACLVGGVVLDAQQPTDVQSENGGYTLHEDTHLVLLDVAVTDKQGRPVAGLTQDKFKLLEDGQPQAVKFFEEHAPAGPAEIARQKTAAVAGPPPNTFASHEPFSGRPICRYYWRNIFGYGFGCGLRPAGLGANAYNYTLYYAPTNGDWNGKYRATTVEVADKELHLTYRKGYYGTPENAEARYYTATGPATAPIAAESESTRTATTVAAGAADMDLSTEAAKAAPNPASSVFSVQVVPADATVVPDLVAFVKDKKTNEGIEKQRQEQEYRQLTLRFSMPASEFKVMPSDAGQYAARLLISAVGYADGKLASSNGGQWEQVIENFNGAADPRIAMSTITATLTLNVLEHGKDRWLLANVRDLATGQFGSMVIPMEQVKMPRTQ